MRRETREFAREATGALLFLWTIAAAAFALLMFTARTARAENISDLRDLHKLGLPAVAEWNVNPQGFDLRWHVAQVQAGHRLIPSVSLPYYDVDGGGGAANPKLADRLVIPYKAEFAWLAENRLPLCLRHNSIPKALTGARYRLPKEPESVAKSPLVWFLKDGALEDLPAADPFGPLEHWRNEGRLLGASPYVQSLAAAHPSPSWVWFAENNEGFYDKPRLAMASGNIDKATNVRALSWRPLEEIAKSSLRIRDRVGQMGIDSDPWDFFPEFYGLRTAQYQGLFSAFRAEIPPSWRNLWTSAYSTGDAFFATAPPRVLQRIGHAPEALAYDGCGCDRYLGHYLVSDLRDPAHLITDRMRSTWEFVALRNARSFRVAYVNIPARAVLNPALKGQHAVITPEMWGAYCGWLAWQCRKPGTPVILHHWIGHASKPTDPIFAGREADLNALGVPELAGLTQEDYVLPILRAVDRICDDATIRRFWLEGGATETAWINPGYWRLTVRLGDESLLYCWSPLKLDGRLTVAVPGLGEVEVEAPTPGAYWVVGREGMSARRLGE